jgi:hypothetical protein
LEEESDCEIPKRAANISTVQEYADFVLKATLFTYRIFGVMNEMNKQVKL